MPNMSSKNSLYKNCSRDCRKTSGIRFCACAPLSQERKQLCWGFFFAFQKECGRNSYLKPLLLSISATDARRASFIKLSRSAKVISSIFAMESDPIIAVRAAISWYWQNIYSAVFILCLGRFMHEINCNAKIWIYRSRLYRMQQDYEQT